MRITKEQPPGNQCLPQFDPGPQTCRHILTTTLKSQIEPCTTNAWVLLLPPPGRHQVSGLMMQGSELRAANLMEGLSSFTSPYSPSVLTKLYMIKSVCYSGACLNNDLIPQALQWSCKGSLMAGFCPLQIWNIHCAPPPDLQCTSTPNLHVSIGQIQPQRRYSANFSLDLRSQT